MPTILQDGACNFIFFSSDQAEPVHIHVKRDRQIVKFWLEPIALAKNRDFKPHELNQIMRLVEQHREMLLEAWDDYFGT